MGNYEISEVIKAIERPEKTILKLNKKNNRAYVYPYTKVKVNGKWKNVYGKVIGYVDEKKGFVSNGNVLSKSEDTCYEFGTYALIYYLCDDLLNKLKKHFHEDDAFRLFIIASIHFAEGYLPIRYVPDTFKQSLFYIIRPDLKLGETAIRNIYSNLGRKTGNCIAFQRELIEESSKNIAIDGHVISSHSDNNELCNLGYKANQYKNGQMNVLMAYDIENDRPLLSKIYEGSLKDNRSVIDLFKIYNFSNVLFIVDKGFYSKNNIDMFSNNGNKYIIPLMENTINYKSLTENYDFDYQKDYFVYDNGKVKRPIVYKEAIYDNVRCFIFRDVEENMKECSDYRSKIGIEASYTEEEFEELKNTFGTLFIQTNLQLEPSEIFTKYKKRWKIETFYNTYKYRLDVKNLDIQDYFEIEGLSFIMLLSSIIDSTIRNKIKDVTGINDLESLKQQGKFIKIQKISGRYSVSNLVSKRETIFDKLGLTFDKMNSILNDTIDD